MSDGGFTKLLKIKKVYGNKYLLNIFIHSVLTKLNARRDWHFNDSRKVVEGLYPHFVKRDQQTCLFNLQLNNNNYQVGLRLKTSDFAVYSQIFIQNEYRLIVEFFKRFQPNNIRMIDLGGNIGLASLHFLSHFPDTKITLLEPNKENIEMCKINLASFPNVELLHNAIYKKEVRLYEDYSFRLGMHSSFRYTEDKNNNPSIDALDISSLILKNKIVDFLKIDIEGAEKEIFETDVQSWLPKVKIIAVEIHDDIVLRSPIQLLLRKNGFILTKYGEYTIGINKSHFNKADVIEFLDGY